MAKKAKLYSFLGDDAEYVKRISKYVNIPDIDEAREPIFEKILDEHYKRFIDGNFLKNCYDEIKATPGAFTGSTSSGYDMILFAESILRVVLKSIAYNESTMVSLLQMHEEGKSQAGLTPEKESKL